jgi:hypothetical protein
MSTEEFVMMKWLFLAIVAFLLMTTGFAAAQHICWIDHVQREAGAVNIYFNKKAHLRVIQHEKAGTQKHFILKEGLIYTGTSIVDKRQDGSDHISARNGDRIHLSQFPEDGCNIEVQVNDKNVGLRVNAYAPVPGGGPPIQRADFIEATPPEKPKQK